MTVKEFLTNRLNCSRRIAKDLSNLMLGKYSYLNFFCICGYEEKSFILLYDDLDCRYDAIIYIPQSQYNRYEIEDMLNNTTTTARFRIYDVMTKNAEEKYWKVSLTPASIPTSTFPQFTEFSPFTDSGLSVNEYLNKYYGDDFIERKVEEQDAIKRNYKNLIPEFLNFLNKLGIDADSEIIQIENMKFEYRI
ncbi:MAG: hypothetical protein ACI4V7_03130 [Succinivibrionaceae bacterium]